MAKHQYEIQIIINTEETLRKKFFTKTAALEKYFEFKMQHNQKDSPEIILYKYNYNKIDEFTLEPMLRNRINLNKMNIKQIKKTFCL